MIVPESTAAIAAATIGPDHVRPIYDGYGFAQIPATIERLLAGRPGGLPAAALAGLPERPRTVVLLLLDAFGWAFFSRHAERYPFLQRFLRDGRVSQLTTAFPSTTAVHVTTLHTGQAADESGVYEWFVYEPSLGAVIGSLLFAPVSDRRVDALAELGVDPAAIYPPARFYQRLAGAGVASTVMQHIDEARSAYTRTVCAGAQLLPYRTVAEATELLRASFAAQRGPALYHLYIDSIDTVMHLHGPDSPHAAAEIDAVLTQLERQLHPVLQAAPGPALLLLTADHGQVATTPQRAIALNRALPDIAGYLRAGADGAPLPPSGSARDLFLHTQAGRVEELRGALQAALGARATVERTADLIAAGYFGPRPGARLRERVGELVVLAGPGEALTWDHPQAPPYQHRGAHGGLSPDEMLTQIAALAYGA